MCKRLIVDDSLFGTSKPDVIMKKPEAHHQFLLDEKATTVLHPRARVISFHITTSAEFLIVARRRE
eukprot:scaffold6315_cov116-Cylindrotheca_fusiformis.AAC.12